MTSSLYYRTPESLLLQRVDTLFARILTLACTGIGAFNAAHGCLFNATGVACSLIAMATYLTKSKRGRAATEEDTWHGLVHAVGAAGFACMVLGQHSANTRPTLDPSMDQQTVTES